MLNFLKLKSSAFLSLIALGGMASLTSCQEQLDVNPQFPWEGGKDAQNISFEVKIPSTDLRTKAGEEPSLTYSTSDGLYLFPRTIDHLWYAVYHKGELKYSSFEDNVPQAYYNPSSKSFKLDIQLYKIDGQVKLNDYAVFFFAGNAADNVQNREIADGIGLDFDNKTVYAYPSYLNRSNAAGDMYNPVQYDFFCKYSTMDKIVNNSYTGSVTLIRPFCQVSLLSDQLTQPDYLATYDNGKRVDVTATPCVNTQYAGVSSESLPYAWQFDSDQIKTKPVTTMLMSLYSRAFDNSSNTYSIPQQVTFKSRKMFCSASYLMLAPVTKKNYLASSTSEKFKFDVQLTGGKTSKVETIGVNIPNGIKANEKYVIYNTYVPPTPPDPPTPGSPDMSVSPTSLDFGTDSDEKTITISNPGTAELNWTIASTSPAIYMSAYLGTIPAGGSSVITIYLDRTKFSSDLSTSFTVSGAGKTQTVNVSATYNAPPTPPDPPTPGSPDMSVSPTSLDFGSLSTEKIITISNPGTEKLDWAVSGTLPESITLSATSGSILAGSSRQVTVYIHRDKFTEDLSTSFVIAGADKTETISVTAKVPEENEIIYIFDVVTDSDWSGNNNWTM